jgi:hypothetical protein
MNSINSANPHPDPLPEYRAREEEAHLARGRSREQEFAAAFHRRA